MIESIQKTLNHPLYSKLIIITLWLILIFTVRYFVNKALNKSIKNVDNKYKARKAFNLISYLFIVVILLFVFRDKIGQFGVTLGLAGAGIAFALQEVIVSFAGWLYISFSGVISTGDRVEIGEVKGDIIDVGILTTTLMELGNWVDGDLYNGRIFSITNSYVLKEKVYNYSAEFPFLWDEMAIPIRIESDFKAAKVLFTKILIEVCGEYSDASQKKWNSLTNKYRVETAQVSPMVTLKFNENYITYTLRYVVDYKSRRMIQDMISSKILEAVSQHNEINIATSTMEVTMANDSTLKKD
jgi:small-conductance mechanosensitive channel